MAICDFCGKEMEGASSCIVSHIRIGGADYTPLPYKRKKETVFTKGEPLQRCPECNILPGGFHHVGCVLELCPKCGEKWVYCRCAGLKVRIDVHTGKKCNIIPFKNKDRLQKSK